MRHFLLVLAFFLAVPALAEQASTMNDYQERINARRKAEAEVLWVKMKADGFTESTVAALDFVYFSPSKANAEDLVKQLKDNYTLELAQASEPGYFLVRGTTRPYGNQFNHTQWLGWVDFMVSVGFSHNAVFSTWSAYDPQKKASWSSELIEVETP